MSTKKIERPNESVAPKSKWIEYANSLESQRDTLLKRLEVWQDEVKSLEAQLEQARETPITRQERDLDLKNVELRGHNPDLPLHLVVSDDWEALTQRVKDLEDVIDRMAAAHTIKGRDRG